MATTHCCAAAGFICFGSTPAGVGTAGVLPRDHYRHSSETGVLPRQWKFKSAQNWLIRKEIEKKNFFLVIAENRNTYAMRKLVPKKVA